MSFLRVLADFTACQPLGLIYAVEARDKEREREEKENRGNGWKRGKKKGRDRRRKEGSWKREKKGQHGSRGVNASINRAFVEGNKKKRYAWMDGGFSTLIKKKKVSGKVKVNQNGLFQNFFPPLSLPLFLLLFHSLSALWCSIFVKREKGRCRFVRFRTNLKNAKAFLKLRFSTFRFSSPPVCN